MDQFAVSIRNFQIWEEVVHRVAAKKYDELGSDKVELFVEPGGTRFFFSRFWVEGRRPLVFRADQTHPLKDDF